MPSGAILAFALACIAPLFAGGVTPGGILVIELAGFAAAAAAAAQTGPGTSARVRAAAAAIGAIGVVGVLQWIPLPPNAVRAISPPAADAWSAASAVLAAEGVSLPAFRLSIAPQQTLATALLALAFAAILWAASILPRTGVAEVMVAAGLLQVLMRSFVITNHDAAFLLMPLCVSMGMARTASGPQRRWSIVAAIVFAGAIVVTGSRGGIIAAGASAAFLLLWNGRPITLAIASACGAAAAMAGATILGDPRTELWKYSLAAWRRFPLIGSGLGSFADAFSLAGAPTALGIVPHAHSGLLQMAVTGGAVCAALTVAAAGAIALARFSRSALGFGAAGATLALAIHGSIDFSFSIPAITATYLCLAGAAMSEDEPSRP